MTTLLALTIPLIVFLLLGLAASAFGADSREGFGDDPRRDILRTNYR
jgi:hypothetical protein